MKKLVLPVLFVCVSLCAFSQKVTDKWLVGKWNIESMTAQGVTVDLRSPEALKASLYNSIRELAPEKVMTADDSARIDEAVKTFSEGFLTCYFQFDGSGGFKAKMSFGEENEDMKGEYRMKGDKLEIKEKDDKKWEGVPVEAIDESHFKLDFSDMQEAYSVLIMTFSRQK